MTLSEKTSRIVAWCDRISFGALCGFIYFVPISIVLVEYAFGFAFLPYVFKRIVLTRERLKRGEKWFHGWAPVPSPVNLPITVFLFICFFSIFISVNPLLSIKAFFFKTLEAVFFYFIAIEILTTPRRLKIFIGIFSVSALLIITNGLVQMEAGKGFIFGHLFEGGRISSTFRHANDYGSYLIVVCLLALGLVVGFWKKSTGVNRVLLLLAVAVFILSAHSLGLTYSRGAWFGFFVGMFLLGIKDIRLLLVSFLVILTFYAAFNPHLLKERKVSLVYDDVHLKEPSEAVSDDKGFSHFFNYKIASKGNMGGSGRSGYWEEALAIIQKFPFGTGLNTYSIVGPDYKVNWGGYPHNCYLHMAAEIGIPGLLSFLWVLFAFIKSSVIGIRKFPVKDPWARGVLMGGFMGAVGFLIHSVVDTNLYSVQLGNLIWVILGLVIAAQKIEAGEG